MDTASLYPRTRRIAASTGEMPHSAASVSSAEVTLVFVRHFAGAD
jgi:hypothetical protein